MFLQVTSAARLKKLALLILLPALGALVFRYPAAVSAGASRGISLCSTVIIPSLLPFLVLTGTFTRSSLCGAVGRRLQTPAAALFRLPGAAAAAVLLSMIGGYPAGAAAVRDLLDNGQITQAQGARLLHFCVNAGPAFAVGAVGVGMLGDARRGWLLFAAQITASLLIGLIEARFAERTPLTPAPPAAAQPLSAAFTAAVNAACLSLLYMCGFVVLFAMLLALADGSGIRLLFDRLMTLPVRLAGGTVSPAVPSLLPGLLEVGSGCLELANGGTPFLLGFFLSFAGLSVHCQVRALVSAYPACCRQFLTYRLLHGLLGGCLSALLFAVTPLPAAAFADGAAALRLFSVSPAASMAMLAMCVTFLLQKGADGRS